MPAWAAAPSQQVGTWYGSGQPGEKGAMYLDRMRPDGSFQARHRLCRKGKSYDQIEAGTWSLAGDILTIKVATVNGVPNARTDLYKILSSSAKAQKYVYLPMNFAYEARRVPDNFEMPSCELVS